MKVLYVSKASRVAAHRDKLALLKQSVDLGLVLPIHWGAQPDEPARPDDPRTITLPALFHGRNHFHVYRGLGEVLDRERPDLVHTDEEPYSAVTGQVAALCARRRIPFVFFAWQNLVKRLPPPFGALRRAVFARAAGGIAGTDRAAEVLRSAGFRGPLAVIPQMGVDPQRFRPDPAASARLRSQLGIEPGRPLVGFVGRLVSEKGVDVLMSAAAALRDAHVVLVGGGPEEGRLRQQAAALGMAERAHFVGAVPSAAIAEWMAALDVLALPSLTTPGWAEQFGRVLIEAMASGVAVVGSDSGEIASVVGDAGIIVAEGSVPGLREALERLVENPAERRRLAAAGRTRVLERFTQSAVVESTTAFYREVLACAGASSSQRSDGWKRRLARPIRARPRLYATLQRIKRAARGASDERVPSPRALREHARKARTVDFSYAGESAHLRMVLAALGIERGYVVDIAAGDGVTQSCTLPLFRDPRWAGLAVEMDPIRFQKLSGAYQQFAGARTVRARVTPAGVAGLLRESQVPLAFEVLNLDIDSYDLWVAEALLDSYRPLVVSMEVNEKIPPPVQFAVLFDEDYVWARDHFYGCSLSAAARTVRSRGYILESLQYNNAFFVRSDVASGVFGDKDDRSAYDEGYRHRSDRRDLFPWNHDVEELLVLPPPAVVAEIERRFRPHAGKFLVGL